MTHSYEKLVRDRIPQIIEADTGAPAQVRVADNAELRQLLLAKLAEETAEFRVDPGVAELADLLEVVRGLADAHGIALADLEAEADRKRAARGGFQAGYVWRAPGPNTHGDVATSQVAVKAALWRGGQLLCVRKHPAFGGQWEIAGGRMDVGEEPQLALRREVSEELGVKLAAGPHPCVNVGFADPLAGFSPLLYLIYAPDADALGEVQLSDEHVGWAWMTAAQVAGERDFNPALRRLLLERWPR